MHFDPLVILNGRTPIFWTKHLGLLLGTLPTSLLYQWIRSAHYARIHRVEPRPLTIKNITYLFINDTAQYDMYVQIDTQRLAQNAQNDWQNSFTRALM